MPIIKSAKKRVRQTATATARNTALKRRIRASYKSFVQAVESGKSADINKARSELDSAIDTAVKKNLIHKNRGARNKSMYARMAKSAGSKPTASKSAKNTTASKAKTKKTATKAKAKTTKK